MSEKSSGCGCCSNCTGGPDCTCGCPDCMCGSCYADNSCDSDCCCGGAKFMLSVSSSIVGMIFLGALALLFSISFLDAAFNTASIIIANDFGFLLFCVAGILALIGVFALRAGDVTEGILFFLVGLSVVILHGSELLGYGSVAYFDWIVIFVLFISMLILFVGRDITFGIGVMFFFIGFAFATAFAPGDLVSLVSGFSFLFAGVVLLYVAITDWLFVETGIDLPLL